MESGPKNNDFCFYFPHKKMFISVKYEFNGQSHKTLWDEDLNQTNKSFQNKTITATITCQISCFWLQGVSEH